MKYVLLIYLSFFVFKSSSQTINYKETFGNDYDNALGFLKRNDSLINKYASDYNVNQKALMAIVFPELIRYDKVYDAIEITSLKFLYIQRGSLYNDFSVGYFQMKPSFAEQVESDASAILDISFLRKIGFYGLSKKYETINDREQRLIRITNLEDQLKYLIVFYKLCENKFKNHKFQNESEKLKFYATAYNSGYYKSEATLRKSQQSKLFYIGKLKTSDTYNYANICAYYYNN